MIFLCCISYLRIRAAWLYMGKGVVQTHYSLSLQVSSIGRFNKSLPPASGYAPLSATSPSVAALKQQLIDSLSLRVLNIPQPPGADKVAHDTRVAVLFSGGLDCTVLARLAHEVMDPEQGIDLLNVAFENPRVVAQLRKDHAKNNGGNGEVDVDSIDFYEACPDRITGRKSFAELQRVCPGRAFRFVAVSCRRALVFRSLLSSSFTPLHFL